MAEDGIVGPYNGSQAREILVTLEQWQDMNGQTSPAQPAGSAPRHSNRILLSPPQDDSPGEPIAAASAPRHAEADHAPFQDDAASDDDFDEEDEEEEEEERTSTRNQRKTTKRTTKTWTKRTPTRKRMKKTTNWRKNPM